MTAAIASGPATDGGKVPALLIRGLTVHFSVRAGGWWRRSRLIEPVQAVDLELPAGSMLGLVGESGCGKSTLGRAVAGLLPAAAGEIHVSGREITRLRSAELRAARRSVQLVFQDPQGSLNPRLQVAKVLREALDAGGRGRARDGGSGTESAGEEEGRGRQSEASLDRLLAEVGLDRTVLAAYPHELSGGQRQRVAIARALAVQPRVLVADEPTSALDVPVQSRILNLLRRVQVQRSLGILLISHDLPLVRRTCRQVAVMYLGRIVEVLPDADVARAKHPYTRALAAAAPSLLAGLAPDERTDRARYLLRDEPPSFLYPPTGCPYHPRCPLAVEACRRELPALAPGAGPGHRVRCPIVLRAGG
jgi:peptide/nickel transport system ATP-binding protein